MYSFFLQFLKMSKSRGSYLYTPAGLFHNRPTRDTRTNVTVCSMYTRTQTKAVFTARSHAFNDPCGLACLLYMTSSTARYQVESSDMRESTAGMLLLALDNNDVPQLQNIKTRSARTKIITTLLTGHRLRSPCTWLCFET